MSETTPGSNSLHVINNHGGLARKNIEIRGDGITILKGRLVTSFLAYDLHLNKPSSKQVLEHSIIEVQLDKNNAQLFLPVTGPVTGEQKTIVITKQSKQHTLTIYIAGRSTVCTTTIQFIFIEGQWHRI